MTTAAGAPVDRDRLAAFLSDLQSLLPEVLNDPQRAGWFLPDLHEPLSSAWADLEPSFNMAIRYLADPPDPDLLDAQLAHVGLRGRQLALKIGGFARAFDRFRSQGTKRAFLSVLGWANIIIGTLAGIVPGGEAIKEYKEAYEQASEDADEHNPRPIRRTGEFEL